MTTEEHNQVGRHLWVAREAAGLSRSTLARHVRLDASYIYRIEVGARRPGRDSILAIAEALGADGEEINKWLTAAGYAPLPFISVVRTAAGTRDGRPYPNAKSSIPADRRAGRWFHWLEAMGLQGLTIQRMMQAIEAADTAQQQKAVRTISAIISRVLDMLETPIHTAIIPVAGGQHQLVAPHVMQCLLLGVIAEAVESGISKVVLVLAPGMATPLYVPLKTAIELSFTPPVELHYCEQASPQGLGDAVLQAETFVEGEPFAVLLPDDVIRRRAGRASHPSELRRMMDAFRRLYGASLIAVTPVHKSKMRNYGVARVGAKAVIPNVRPITQLVEKPAPAHPVLRSPKAYGIVGRYLMQPDIFLALHRQKEEAHSRAQLTDALEWVRRGGASLYAVEMKSQRRDIGEMLGRTSELIGVPAGAGADY